MSIDSLLTKTPSNNEINPIYLKIKKFIQEIEQLNNQFELLKKQQNDLDVEYNILLRRLDKIRKTANVSDQTIKSRILKVHKVLDKYSKRIKTLKIDLLEKMVLKNFKTICQKASLLEKNKIDPTTFLIELIGKDGKKWHRKFLSKGEKQLFALSILWALTELSGKSFPFIIDTPLGRLDKDHRDGLVNDFFLKASQQMILLSTNEEIDSQLYQELRHHISRSYLLEYDYTNQLTHVSENAYFFKLEAV